MPISAEPTGVTFDDDSFWVSLADGRIIGVPLAWYPRLLAGSAQARLDYFLSPSGIHWEKLDEDVSVAGILAAQLDRSDEPRRAA